MATIEEKYKHVIESMITRKDFEGAFNAQSQYVKYLENINETYYEGWMRKWDELEKIKEGN